MSAYLRGPDEPPMQIEIERLDALKAKKAQFDLSRLVVVKDVSYEPIEPDQTCTIAEFIAYNFDGSCDWDEYESEQFKEKVLRGETYRLYVALGCQYDIRLAD